MTQPPLPPQMPPEPLDESERAIARALRNLPVGAPPPELDARILGAARRAVHLSPPRKTNQLRWLVGFGTAASALLAIGLFVKTHGPAQDALYTPPAETGSAAPASAPVAAAPAAMKDRVEPQPTADAIAPAGNAESAQSGVPVEAPPPKQQYEPAHQAFGNLSAAKSAPQAFPPAVEPPPPPQPMRSPPPHEMPAPVVMTPPVVMQESAPMAAPPASPPPAQAMDARQERKVEQDDDARRDAAATTSVAAPVAPAAAGGTARDQPALNKTTSNALKSTAADLDQPATGYANTPKDKSLDRVEVTGSRIKRANDEGTALPPIDDDAKLAPTQWIERIRARVKAADGDGARESLRRYRLRYPDASIPGDLFPLLR